MKNKCFCFTNYVYIFFVSAFCIVSCSKNNNPAPSFFYEYNFYPTKNFFCDNAENIYVVDTNCNLNKIDKSGVLLWQKKIANSNYLSSIVFSGTFFYACINQGSDITNFLSIDTSGTVIRNLPINGITASLMYLAGNNKILLIGTKGTTVQQQNIMELSLDGSFVNLFTFDTFTIGLMMTSSFPYKCVTGTYAGGIAITGSFGNNVLMGPYRYQFYNYKYFFDANLNLIQKKYDTTFTHSITNIIATGSDNYFAINDNYDGIVGLSDINNFGTETNSFPFSFTNVNSSTDIISKSDGNLLVGITNTSYPNNSLTGNYTSSLLDISLDFTIKKTVTLNVLSKQLYLINVLKAPDGNNFVIGLVESPGNDYLKTFLLKFDANENY